MQSIILLRAVMTTTSSSLIARRRLRLVLQALPCWAAAGSPSSIPSILRLTPPTRQRSTSLPTPCRHSRAIPFACACQSGHRIIAHQPSLLTAGTLRSTLVAQACPPRDRKSTRLNSSHVKSSYAVFFLQKKKREHTTTNC